MQELLSMREKKAIRKGGKQSYVQFLVTIFFFLSGPCLRGHCTDLGDKCLILFFSIIGNLSLMSAIAKYLQCERVYLKPIAVFFFIHNLKKRVK